MPGAYGAFMFDSLPYAHIGAGLRTSFGTLLPPGGRVNYVRSTGQADGDPPELTGRIFTTLNAACGECRSGRGDVVIVLPGHAENISVADQVSNLLPGTKVIGIGDGNERPTFTWTTAAASLLPRSNCRLENLILNMDPGAGSVNVAAPLSVLAPGVSIVKCKIRMGTDANSLVTIGITTGAAGDDLVLAGNEIFGATAAECTTMFQFVGADRLKLFGNTIVGATSAVGVGVIRFLTTASTDIKMFDNLVRNNKAASTAAITGMAGISGDVDFLMLGVLSGAAAALVLDTGAFGTVGNLQFGSNVYVNNVVGRRAALMTPLSA